MRLIFIVLFIVNVGFFIVQLLGKSPEVKVSLNAESLADYGDLRTIAERNVVAQLPDQGSAKRMAIGLGVSSSKGEIKGCELIGPFVELLHAEYLAENLTARGGIASVRQIPIDDGKNFLVYLPPEISESEALRRLNEIQQGKNIDSYIIPSGELENGIAFGQFSDYQEAITSAEYIKSQGYAAAIQESPRRHNEIWVQYDVGGGQKMTEGEWLDLLKGEKSVERRENSCLGIAQ
jgi:hypothetical protein